MNVADGRKTATTDQKNRFRQKTTHQDYASYDRPLNSEKNVKS